MNITIKILICSLLCLSTTPGWGQNNWRTAAWLISPHLGGAVPGGDLADRFGANAALGLSGYWMSEGGWLIGAEGSYLFGNTVRDEVLAPLTTADGFIIGSSGQPAEVRFYQRGYRLPVISLGRVVKQPLLRGNDQSGWMFTAGAGFVQHKIRLEDVNGEIGPLQEEYIKGYDRLTNGVAVVETIGYLHLDRRRLLNFYLALEFTQAFTQNRRSFDFATRQRLEESRLDLMWGMRFGWLFPIYRTEDNEFYYY